MSVFQSKYFGSEFKELPGPVQLKVETTGKIFLISKPNNYDCYKILDEYTVRKPIIIYQYHGIDEIHLERATEVIVDTLNLIANDREIIQERYRVNFLIGKIPDDEITDMLTEQVLNLVEKYKKIFPCSYERDLLKAIRILSLRMEAYDINRIYTDPDDLDEIPLPTKTTLLTKRWKSLTIQIPDMKSDQRDAYFPRLNRVVISKDLPGTIRIPKKTHYTFNIGLK
jgi:hypothetical protein